MFHLTELKIIGSFNFFIKFILFLLRKIIKNKKVDIFEFCQLVKYIKIMIRALKDIGAKIKTHNFGKHSFT